LQVPDGVARLGRVLSREGQPLGQVCSTAWSPYLQCGVAIVRLDDPDLGPGTALEVACHDDRTRTARTCALPMYDPDRLIPRGRATGIPEIPPHS
jgi:aminomethyltransferase